ncbi:WAT1-related protein [Canna indica]|uniref:WAT1-related protein n=1 Tax=Canna indica TaxID=4628 RepID=A0AAQ3Q6S1_9LILI|nr:WAT1-related protein [Canna indica]
MKKYGPALGMLYVQVSYAAMFLITRFALSFGMSSYSFVLYRQLIATLTICPLAYYLHRHLSLSLSLSLCDIDMTTIVLQGQYAYSQAEEREADLPPCTDRDKHQSELLLCWSRIHFLHLRQHHEQSPTSHYFLTRLPPQIGASKYQELEGASKDPRNAAVSGRSHGDDAWIVEEYPSQLSLSGLVSFMGSLQCAVIILLLEKPSALRLQWDLQLLAVAYSGIFCAGFAVFTIMWCVKEKGPVYATAFNPMSAVLVAIFEPLLLQVQPSWSSLTGMLMVIGGLYLFLWGKAQDRNVVRSNAPQQYMDGEGEGSVSVNEACSEESSNHEPLLAENNT